MSQAATKGAKSPQTVIEQSVRQAVEAADPVRVILFGSRVRRDAREDSDIDFLATHTEYVSKFDGKEVPYTGNPNADTASPKKINANSYDNPWKKDGKPTMSSHAVVSKDGKTFTVHQTGKNAKGEAVDTTVVFIKQ